MTDETLRLALETKEKIVNLEEVEKNLTSRTDLQTPIIIIVKALLLEDEEMRQIIKHGTCNLQRRLKQLHEDLRSL